MRHYLLRAVRGVQRAHPRAACDIVERNEIAALGASVAREGGGSAQLRGGAAAHPR
jgi:hypothetical protein